MKHLFKINTLACIALSQALSFSATAQTCDNATSLNISTGITAAGAKITTNTADPFWDVAFLSSALTPYGSVGDAIVIPPGTPNKPGSWYSSASAEWISIATFHYPTTASGTYEIRLKRSFRLCKKDSLQFLLGIANDNYCTDVKIDGTSVLPIGAFPQAVSASPANLSAASACNFNKVLTAGTHDITITFYNYAFNSPGQPQALLLEGTINSLSGISSLVTNTSDSNCNCSSTCNDSCYWRVDGNTILGGKNTFGTLSNDDVLIKTNNVSRGMMSRNGLLGWNTLAPTAYLHVNCLGNNPQQSGMSDIRFENLEQGDGSVLVIDNNTGYVFNSYVSLSSVSMLMAENKRLSEELVTLKEQVAMIQAKMTMQPAAAQSAGSSSYLIKNVPNPFGSTTAIEYYLDADARNAQLLITDMNGKLVRTIQLGQVGFGSVTVDMAGLSSGMYQYSLNINGKQTDTRKMISK